jgi:hypothetical protein
MEGSIRGIIELALVSWDLSGGQQYHRCNVIIEKNSSHLQCDMFAVKSVYLAIL